MKRRWIAAMMVFAANACTTKRPASTSGGGPDGNAFPPGSFGATCSAGAATALSGIALAPNGKDPVAAAHVYVVDAPAPLTPGVACDVCDHPLDTPRAATVAAADGRFTLSIDALPQSASVKLVVAKGRFRRVTDLNVTACQTTTVAAPATALPGSSRDGDVPKIAVATGSQDHLDVVLDALGVTEFDCYVGTRSGTRPAANTPCQTATADIESLLADPARLATYNMLFLSCAPGKYASLSAPATAIANLAAWVHAGGRLFATDESYDYVEQAFPASIDFYPGSSTPSTAQSVDQANLGVGAAAKMGGASYPGTITDADLETWLQAVGSLTPESNTLTLDGFLNPWAAAKDVDATVRTAVTATAAWYTTGATTLGSPSTTATMPMTVEWDDNMCGRVLFSSYHTLANTMKGAALSPQEKILEYLVLDVGSCLGPIG